MSHSFKEILGSGKFKSLWDKREGTFIKIDSVVTAVNKLETDNPTKSHVRRFAGMDKDATELLADLKKQNYALMDKLAEAGMIKADKDYLEDQAKINKCYGTLIDTVETYRDILIAKNLVDNPDEKEAEALAPAPQDFLEALVKRMEASDDKSAKALKTYTEALYKCTRQQTESHEAALEKYSNTMEKISKNNINIKRPQPKFTPDGTIDDYFRYREWYRKFEFYTAKIDENDYEERTEWLRTCLVGDALTLIQSCAATQEGYTEAIELLEGKYKDVSVIQEALFDYFHRFTISSVGKNYKGITDKLTQFRNYLHELEVELNTPFNYKGYLGHVALKSMPAEVKKEFMVTCASLTPDLDQILEKADEVVRKLNVYSGVNPVYPDLTKKSNLNSNTSTQNQLSTTTSKSKSKRSRSKNKSGSSALNVLGSGPPPVTPLQGSGSSGTPNHGQPGIAGGVQPNSGQPNKGKNVRFIMGRVIKPSKCRFCQGKHESKNCGTFQTVSERKKYLNNKHTNLCTVCASPSCDGDKNNHHQESICKFPVCTAKNAPPHPVSLCVEFINANKSTLCQNTFVVATNSAQTMGTNKSKYDPAEPECLSLSINVAGRKARTTALETALLLAQNPEASHLPPHDRHVALMTDTCAQRSVVSKHIVDKYKFPIIGTESVALQGFNERSPRCMNYKVAKITIGKDKKRPIVLDALIVHDINDIMMVGVAAFAKKVAHLANLADFRFLSTKSDQVSVDLLVGAEHRWKIVSPTLKPRQLHGMWCPRTIYNDIMLTGTIPGADGVITNSTAGTNTITLLNINALPTLQVLENDEYVLEPNLWDVAKELTNYDNLGITITSKQDQDREALENFQSTVSKDPVSNAYVVGFPWLGNSVPNKGDLDSNLDLVKNRFLSTMKTLDNNPEKLKEYAKVHQSEVDNDFIERLPDEELSDEKIFKHFITHFPVIKETEGCTTKVRRVFDASLHKKGKASLNDLMAKGSQLTPHILKVLLCMRLTPFVLSADISKAFLRMSLLPRDRNYTCFLARKNWEDPNSPIEVWRFKSVLFGATSSPFLLNCSIADILEQNEFDEAMEVFVDNLFVLLEEEENILKAAGQLSKVFSSNAMPLHELASNSVEANRQLKENNLGTENEILKTLGLWWNYNDDTWTINKPTFTVDTASKRSLLSDLARIFDPLGFLAILTIRGKLILQKAMEGVFTWDGTLPPEIQTSWTKFVSSINVALDIPIPRWLGISMRSSVALHMFTDSSNLAMGCVAYLVQGKTSSFISCKAKITPRREQHYSIPRKELTALSLGVRFIKFIYNSVKNYKTFSSVHLWSDSTTCLNWALAKQSHKELFIRARVDHLAAVVKELGIVYHYITSETNPADLLTKDSDKGPNHPFWLNGPEVLQYPERWVPFRETRTHKDMIPVFCGVTVEKDPCIHYAGLPHPKKFDSLNELYNNTAIIKWNSASSDNKKKAELLWIQKVQSFHFSDVISFLKSLDGNFLRSKEGKKILRKHKLNPPNICLNLHLMLDRDGLIRVYTSVQNYKGLSYDQINPILMPSEDPFTLLIAKSSHRSVGHMGKTATIRNMRNKFWVTKYTKVVNHVIKDCKKCICERGKRYHVPGSPELPEFRFDLDTPFATTAVDMTGFFLCKEKDGKESKAYILLFVCMSTGCGHVEVIDSASAEVFSQAVERFMAHRGVPLQFFSDNGSNMKGYFPELKELSNYITKEGSEIQQGINWIWTPSLAPHFNGFCERSVGLIKGIIKKAVGRKILTFGQLSTVAAYAQAVFNERPLHVMTNTDPDYIPITPNMLVFGRNLRMLSHDVAELNLQDPDFRANKRKSIPIMALKLRDTLASVRKNWREDYFQFLTAKDALRNKCSPHKKSLIIPKIDHFVLVKDDSSDLRVGKIKELIPSSDGEIRQALVSTKHGQSIFPILKLRYLEGYRDEEIVSAPEQVSRNQTQVREKLSRLAKDRANEKIQEFAQINNIRLENLFLKESRGEYLVREQNHSSPSCSPQD